MCNSNKRKNDFLKCGSQSSPEMEKLRTFAMELGNQLFDNEDVTQQLVDRILRDPFSRDWNIVLESGEFAESWRGVCEEYRDIYAESLGNNCEKVILPPHPCNTRFGTWLVVINYCYHFWEVVKNFVLNKLDAKKGKKSKKGKDPRLNVENAAHDEGKKTEKQK